MRTKKLLRNFGNGDTLKERVARIEALLCHVIDNDLKHLWQAVLAIIGLLTGILAAIIGGLIAIL